jgi:hypothetical protein
MALDALLSPSIVLLSPPPFSQASNLSRSGERVSIKISFMFPQALFNFP